MFNQLLIRCKKTDFEVRPLTEWSGNTFCDSPGDRSYEVAKERYYDPTYYRQVTELT